MWETINNILAVIGLVSLLMTVVRIIWTFSGSTEWINNVRIEEHQKDEDLDGANGMYPQYYPDDPSRIEYEYANQNLFIPESTIIRKAVLKEVAIVENSRKYKEKYKKIKSFEVISPQFPICLVVERAECIPRYLMEWKTEYGGRARYYFCAKLRDGYNNKSGFEYHYGFWAKVRKVLDLK